MDWFTHTFNKLSVAMGVLAIAVGPVVTAAHDLGGGNLGPFKLSLAVVAVNGFQLIAWRRDANKSCPAFADTGRLASRAWSAVMSGGQVAMVATAQGCFEAATFAFALLWTPLVDVANTLSTPEGDTASEPPWGMVFAQQLGCVMIGSVVFKLVTSLYPGATADRMCVCACAGGAVCFAGLSLGLSLTGAQVCLLGFEGCVGVYLNGMGAMRSKYVPQEVSVAEKTQHFFCVKNSPCTVYSMRVGYSGVFGCFLARAWVEFWNATNFRVERVSVDCIIESRGGVSFGARS